MSALQLTASAEVPVGSQHVSSDMWHWQRSPTPKSSNCRAKNPPRMLCLPWEVSRWREAEASCSHQALPGFLTPGICELHAKVTASG